MKEKKDFRVSVETDALDVYGESPITAVFNIDARKARNIVRLMDLVRKHNLYKIEQLDHSVEFRYETVDGRPVEPPSWAYPDHPRVEGCRLEVSAYGFAYRAYGKDDDTELWTDVQPVDALVEYFGIAPPARLEEAGHS